MKPPYHIPLTKTQKALIGEICAIQGQIEDFLQQSVCFVIGLSPELGNKLL